MKLIVLDTICIKRYIFYFIYFNSIFSRRRLSLQVQHANDSFLALTTDGINFLLSDQEICDVINKCQDPTEAAEVIAQQVLKNLSAERCGSENPEVSSHFCRFPRLEVGGFLVRHLE